MEVTQIYGSLRTTPGLQVYSHEYQVRILNQLFMDIDYHGFLRNLVLIACTTLLKRLRTRRVFGTFEWVGFSEIRWTHKVTHHEPYINLTDKLLFTKTFVVTTTHTKPTSFHFSISLYPSIGFGTSIRTQFLNSDPDASDGDWRDVCQMSNVNPFEHMWV
ncbi:hypothetical protein [Joinjakaka virus]|uniref:Uncharacterized protein n=1 Tax=Joinjakaka virus TaxID=1272943 RepID=A0A0D3R1N8_9RHAB|nr:hypothetical protein [Joinjakaka virus]AJR28536.1 hypothetical protein [Joinjakaka virus]